MDQIAKESELRFKSKEMQENLDADRARPQPVPQFPTPRFPHRAASEPSLLVTGAGNGDKVFGSDAPLSGSRSPSGSLASPLASRSSKSKGSGSSRKSKALSRTAVVSQDPGALALQMAPSQKVVMEAAGSPKHKLSEARREHLKALLAKAHGW
eukprot:CAMPEP_0177389538 /NCGR_PEP_ID=MMETSP0368-20130122/52628_1 /TAXON_ID=447022 ORGANISM="Scrippsiella hangoei-like, Strain SHHI-4" /NCGR_SAMPLE_ID=MMETSP0368 /ASSEMBLY_ACC=CAM_ASM_000363 /LENGTH=153 /DNA_ID=CAMNT_0018854975 /DNA_START=1 /DNA_END=460 /DNA_ORIENTATION=+